MKRMISILTIGCLLWFGGISAHAEDSSDYLDYFNTEAQLEALGVGELKENLPETARELLQESGLDDLSVDNLLHLSPRDFFQVLWRNFLEQLHRPVMMLGALIGIAVLCALLSGLRDSAGEGGLSPVFAVVAVLCTLASVAAPVLECIISTVDAIRDASLFMLGYIPVYSAAVIASGSPATGAAYNAFLFATCQMVSQVVSQTLLPLMSLYLALAIAGSLAPELGISSVCATVKKIVTWSLGFVTTMFVGILSVQTMVTGSADSLGIRAGKFFIGSFVPVVGGALSEAMLAAQGCLRLIRSSVGAFGIVAALFLFLPTFFQVIAWILTVNLAGIASDVLGVKPLSDILKSCSGVLGILVSFLLCYVLVIIVTITVIMVTGMPH